MYTDEADGRTAFIAEALSWIGTPFADKCRIKGRNGCADCVNLPAEAAFGIGLLPRVEIPDYPPRWMLRKSEPEWLLDFLTDMLGMQETADPKPGDLHAYQFGWKFSHLAIRSSPSEIVHAYAATHMVIVSRIDEPLLTHIPLGKSLLPRPVKYFDLWSAVRHVQRAQG